MTDMVRFLSGTLMALLLALHLGGCAQSQGFLQEDSSLVKQRERMDWVDTPSAQSTDWGVYGDEEGAP